MDSRFLQLVHELSFDQVDWLPARVNVDVGPVNRRQTARLRVVVILGGQPCYKAVVAHQMTVQDPCNKVHLVRVLEQDVAIRAVPCLRHVDLDLVRVFRTQHRPVAVRVDHEKVDRGVGASALADRDVPQPTHPRFFKWIGRQEPNEDRF